MSAGRGHPELSLRVGREPDAGVQVHGADVCPAGALHAVQGVPLLLVLPHGPVSVLSFLVLVPAVRKGMQDLRATARTAWPTVKKDRPAATAWQDLCVDDLFEMLFTAGLAVVSSESCCPRWGSAGQGKVVQGHHGWAAGVWFELNGS